MTELEHIVAVIVGESHFGVSLAEFVDLLPFGDVLLPGKMFCL